MGPLPSGQTSWLINGGDPNHLQVLGWFSKLSITSIKVTWSIFSPSTPLTWDKTWKAISQGKWWYPWLFDPCKEPFKKGIHPTKYPLYSSVLLRVSQGCHHFPSDHSFSLHASSLRYKALESWDVRWRLINWAAFCHQILDLFFGLVGLALQDVPAADFFRWIPMHGVPTVYCLNMFWSFSFKRTTGRLHNIIIWLYMNMIPLAFLDCKINRFCILFFARTGCEPVFLAPFKGQLRDVSYAQICTPKVWSVI